nr:heparanase-like protein 3 [Tanacetum cinerariifolium]
MIRPAILTKEATTRRGCIYFSTKCSHEKDGVTQWFGVGTWDSTNADTFMCYTVKKNYSVYGWELGRCGSAIGMGRGCITNVLLYVGVINYWAAGIVKRMRLVKHGLVECEFEEDGSRVMVVKVVHEYYRMVEKEIDGGLLEEMEKFRWWFEQDINGEKENDNEKRLMMVNEEGWMS